MSESLLLPSAFKLEAPTPCVGGGGLTGRFAPAEDLGPGRGAEALKIAGFFSNGHRLMWFKGVSRGNHSAG